MSGVELLFALLGVALPVIPWALSELDVEVPRGITRGCLVVAIGCLIGAFAVPVYEIFFTPVTFVYLILGRSLGENSAAAPREMITRRVFVLQQEGPGVLHNVQIELYDNHARGTATADHFENYPEIDPGQSDVNRGEPIHFWFHPSTPWDEDYTVAISAREASFSERIRVKGFLPPGAAEAPGSPPTLKVTPGAVGQRLPPGMGKVALAISVTQDNSNSPLFACEDAELQNLPPWLVDRSHLCRGLPNGTSAFLDPQPFTLWYPSGMTDMTPALPPLLSTHPEDEPSTRTLTNWQKEQMTKQLRNFPGQKILILVSGDTEAWRYAEGFRSALLRSKWVVKGPIPGPTTNCTPADVSLWSWKRDPVTPRPVAEAVKNALVNAGVKGAANWWCILNTQNALVLWVGAKTPDEIKDDAPTCPQQPSPAVDKLASSF